MNNKLVISNDIVILGISSQDQNNYRKNTKKKLSVLLTKKEDSNGNLIWTLPFETLKPNKLDNIGDIIEKETSIKDAYYEQLYTFDKVSNDTRVLSISYLSLVNLEKVKLTNNSAWFEIALYNETENRVNIVLMNGKTQLTLNFMKYKDFKTSHNYSYELANNEKMPLVNATAIVVALNRLKNKLNYTDVVFNLMPDYFTLSDLQAVFETILGKKLLDPAFRRGIANKVEETNKIQSGSGHRPSKLFTHKNN